MNVEEFLKSRSIWVGTLVPDMSAPENYRKLTWLLQEYHQAMLTDPTRLKQLVWDGLLTAQHQDEQWNDTDTCRLIVSKIMNDGPITYPNAKI